MNPNYKVQLGNMALAPSQAADLETFQVRLSMEAPADSFEAVLRNSSSSSKVKSEDPVSVSLGYDTDLTHVFAGSVDVVEVGMSRLRILGLSNMAKLLKLRVNRTYLKQTAGDIVKDLCNMAQVSTGDVQDGVTLPSFFISHEVPAYEYVKGLADRSGFDVYFTPNNRIAFKEYKPETTHELQFGLNVLEVEAVHFRPPPAVKVFGESPSSVKGTDTAHWLTKNEVEGSAGSGQAILVFDPAVKDKSTADQVARSKLARAKQALQVSIITLGDPKVKLGDAVSLEGFDHRLLTGEFKVQTAEHSVSKRSGFTTRIVCSKEA